MSNKAYDLFKNFKKSPRDKSTIIDIQKCLKQLDPQDGAMFMHHWIGHHLLFLEKAFSRFALEMMEYTANSWSLTAEESDSQALKYYNNFSERFEDLPEVMSFIEKRFPQLLELPSLEEGKADDKIFVQYLSLRESCLFNTSYFYNADFYEKIANGFAKWNFRSVLEQWASNDVYLEQKEEDVLLQAAFSVDKKANLNCIKKWWRPEEELACEMDPTVRFAIHSKYTEKYVSILQKNDTDRKNEAAFYNHAMWHGFVGCLNQHADCKHSSFSFVLKNTFAHDEEKSALVDDYEMIAKHLKNNKGIQFQATQKIEVVKQLLVAAAKEKNSESLDALDDTFTFALEFLREESQLLGSTLLLNPSCRPENIDVVFSMEMHGYFEAIEEDQSRDQHFLKSNSSEPVEKDKELERYFLKIKALRPTLFYVLSDFLSDSAYQNRMVELKKILNKKTLGDEWAENFRLPVNTELLYQWLETTLHALKTNNGPQDNIEMVFETIKQLAPEEKITHVMPLALSGKPDDVEQFMMENGLDSSLMTPIVSLVEEVKGAECGQQIHNLFHKYYLNKNVKAVKKNQNQPLFKDSRF